ncbi:MAG: helix-turn-helix domain-containing protein [Halobacteria archaeon]
MSPDQTALRAELVVGDPSGCPVAEAVDEKGEGVSIARTRGSPPVTEEVAIEGTAVPDDAESVVDREDSTVYRFERNTGGCVCERVEENGHPVVDARVRDGDLYVSFHVPDREALRQIVESLRDAYPSVGVRRVTTADPDDTRLVYADELTDRQREALETAHRMGYFNHPKRSNATEVADEMGIAVSTFTEHLSTAQRKLLDDLL